MAHGAPDYSNIVKQSLQYTLTDMAELAVRLDSPVNFSRSGEVAYFTTFDTGIGDWTLSTSSGSELGLTLSPTYHGEFALQFLGAATGAGSSSAAKIIPYVQYGGVGLSLIFNMLSGVDKFDIELRVGYAPNRYGFVLRVDNRANTVSLKRTDGTFVTIATYAYNLTIPLSWAWFKLVVNPLTGYYSKLLVNDLIYDLSAYAGTVNAQTHLASITLFLTLTDNNFGDNDVVIDNVIVTTNEEV